MLAPHIDRDTLLASLQDLADASLVLWPLEEGAAAGMSRSMVKS